MGNDGFKWFIGVVQSINDPMNCGRVRIRCMGWHTPDMEELPVDMLPWAQVMMPITSASNSGIGRSPTGLLQGSFVVGFFLDGEEAQQPVVMGSIHGIPSEDNDPGYSDPDGVYPSQPGIPDTPNFVIAFSFAVCLLMPKYMVIESFLFVLTFNVSKNTIYFIISNIIIVYSCFYFF
jgi:hypothetical protein